MYLSNTNKSTLWSPAKLLWNALWRKALTFRNVKTLLATDDGIRWFVLLEKSAISRNFTPTRRKYLGTLSCQRNSIRIFRIRHIQFSRVNPLDLCLPRFYSWFFFGIDFRHEPTKQMSEQLIPNGEEWAVNQNRDDPRQFVTSTRFRNLETPLVDVSRDGERACQRYKEKLISLPTTRALFYRSLQNEAVDRYSKSTLSSNTNVRMIFR